MMRQFCDQFGRHGDGTGVAVAGGYAVDGAVFAQQAIEEVGAAADRGAECRFVGQHDLGRSRSDVDNVFNR